MRAFFISIHKQGEYANLLTFAPRIKNHGFEYVF